MIIIVGLVKCFVFLSLVTGIYKSCQWLTFPGLVFETSSSKVYFWSCYFSFSNKEWSCFTRSYATSGPSNIVKSKLWNKSLLGTWRRRLDHTACTSSSSEFCWIRNLSLELPVILPCLKGTCFYMWEAALGVKCHCRGANTSWCQVLLGENDPLESVTHWIYTRSWNGAFLTGGFQHRAPHTADLHREEKREALGENGGQVIQAEIPGGWFTACTSLAYFNTDDFKVRSWQ